MRILLSLCTLLCVAMPAHAEGLPPEMMVEGKPIDPMCFGDVLGEQPQKEIKFKDCGSGYKVIQRTAEEDGRFQSADYEGTQSEDDATFPGAYNAYSYIGKQGDALIVLFLSSSGGTGQFSSLLRLKREVDHFVIQDWIAGGDRCNGGIADVHMDKNGAVVYEQNATSDDLFKAGVDPKNPDLKSVDLDACAVCCYGTIVYVDGKVDLVTLYDEEGHDYTNSVDGDPDTAMRPQVCFNRMARKGIADGKINYSLPEWKNFIIGFEKICLNGGNGK